MQACKALREEGYRVVLVNSNPATIMTDPDMADATYIEPITPEFVEKIIARERPNVPEGRVFALLPTMGGQTALNTALSLRKRGALEKYDVELIGASAEAIDKAEDRELFRQAMMKIGLDVPKGVTLKGDLRHKKDAAGNFLYDGQNNPIMELAPEVCSARAARRWTLVGLPAVIRPSFTLGGTGGGIAYNREEFFEIVERGPRRLADQRGADRGIRARLEGVSRWRSCATAPTTPSSSAPSRTSTRWACTPAIPSPSPRR